MKTENFEKAIQIKKEIAKRRQWISDAQYSDHSIYSSWIGMEDTQYREILRDKES